MNFDPQDVCRAIETVAKEEILPFFRHLDNEEIYHKSHQDVVTAVDLRSEKALSTALRDIAPKSAVLGEESAEESPEIFALLDNDDPFWVIDPLDGTKNFIAGRPLFAVIVAYCAGGETLGGWIYDPCGDVMVHARKGEGAWLGTRSLRKISTDVSLGQATASLGPGMRKRIHEAMRGPSAGAPLAHENRRENAHETPREVLVDPSAPPIEEGIAEDAALHNERSHKHLRSFPQRIVRYGCCGREYIDLALGKIHYALYGGNLNVWDHAAGVLIHREVGGYEAVHPRRTPYRPRKYRNGERLVLAPSDLLWEEFRKNLMP